MAGKQRYTAEQVCAVLMQTKGLLYLAAKHLGCSYQTVCNYVQRYPTVKAALEPQRGEMVDHAESMLYASILKGEAWGITLCLKTLGRDRGYVERTEQRSELDMGVGLAELLEARKQLKAQLDALAGKARENGQGPES